MDVTGIFNAGGVVVKNPNYSKSKKNTQPKYITVTDFSQLPSGSTTGTALTDVAYQGAERNGVILGDYKDWKKYINHGITPNSIEQDLDIQLANNQSFLEKAGNSLLQTVVNEIGIGTVKGFSDILDLAGQITGVSDGDYTNPLSKYLEEKQEEFREWAPVFVDPNKNIANGGLLDSGWWFSNMPSIMSSVSLMIPGLAVTRIGSAISKAMKLTSFTRNAVRTLTGAEKAIKAGKELNAVQRVLNSEATAKQVGLFLENGTTAVLSRAAENYQEARQTYSDNYQDFRNTIDNMNDAEYAKFIKDNKQLLQDKQANPNNKDEVAKAIASAAADRTFQMDWANVVFDVVQMYGLRNAWKGLKNAHEDPISLKRANKDAAKYLGKSKEEIAKLKAARPTYKKAGQWIGDNIYGSGLAVASELSEGVEEAVNYIAQQEGVHFGNTLLNKEAGSKDTGWLASMSKYFDPRMKQYVTAPELWDSAFWGVLGGVMFQKIGSQFNKIRQKLTTDKSEAQQEAKESLPWYKLDELPETKRRLSDIQARNLDFQEYQKNLAKINQGIDVYKSSENNEVKFDTEEEQKAAADKLKNEYIAKMTLRAMNSGNLNMLKAYINNDDFRNAIIEQGIFGDTKGKSKEQVTQEARQYTDDALNTINKVEKAYDEELVAINAAAANISKKNNNNIPIEYMQIMAVNNVKSRLERENIDTELVPVNKRIAELKTQFAEQLDPNINYDHVIKVGILTKQLGELYATKRHLMKNEDKSLSNQLAIKRIDKRIESIENDLNDEELVYGNFIGLQYKVDKDGNIIKSKDNKDLQEAFAYRDAQIVKELNDGKTTSINIPGLEFLSNRSRKTINEETIGKYKTLESDAKTVFDSIKNISPELNNLLQTKILLEKHKDYINSELTRTVKQVEEEANILHNTMNEARVEAINQANKIVQNLYKKYGNTIREAIYNRVNNNSSKHEALSDEENNALNNALEVLDLTKSYNANLVDSIERQFDIQDIIKEQQEVQDKDNDTSDENGNDKDESETKSESKPKPGVSSTIIQNPTTETSSSQPINQSETPQETPIGQEIEEQGNNQIIQTLPQTSNPPLASKITIDKNNNVAYSTDNGLDITLVTDNDGNKVIGIGNNEAALNDDLFDNVGEVDLTRPIGIETNPYIDKDNKIHKGHLYNTDSIEGQETQQAEEEKGSQPEQLNTPQQENESTPQASSESTPQVSSTGEQTAPQSSPAKAQLPKTKNIEEVPDQTSSADAIENSAIQSCIKAFKANHDIDLDNYTKELIDDFVGKGFDRVIVEKAVTRAAGIIKRTIEKLKNKYPTTMRSSVDEYIIESSIIELSNKDAFGDEFVQAARTLINQYSKENGIRLINGKKYINLEEMLRYINKSTSDNTTANFIYYTLKEYLKTDKAKEEFITIDEDEIDNNNFLDNVAKSTEERYKEKLEDITVQRVDINTILKQLDDKQREEFYQALDELQKDEEIQTKVYDNKILLYDNKNRLIGRLPIPYINPDTGAYIVYNDGWKYDILDNNGKISSQLKDLFIKWINSKDETSKALNDIIYELAFGKPTKERKAELLNKFSSNGEIIRAKAQGLTHKSISDAELANGLVKLWQFVKLPNTEVNNLNNILLKSSINLWFKKLNNSYDSIIALKNEGAVKITVANISDGELIKVQDNVTNASELPLASEAIAGGVNPSVHKIAIGDKFNVGTVKVSGHSSIKFNGVGRANTFIMLSNRSNRPTFIQAFPISTSDPNIGKEAKEIITAIKVRISNLLHNYSNENTEDNYNALKEFLINTFSCQNGNNTLFNGIIVTVNNKLNNESISVAIPGTSFVFQFYKLNKYGHASSLVKIKKDGVWENIPFNSEDSINYINNIIDKLNFKFNFSYIEADNVSDMSLKGIATRHKGKFEITVGDQTWSYNSFNEFILNNNLVRLNTKPSEDGKSNFKPRGENQKANQVFEIKIERQNSSPVEETTQTTSTESFNQTTQIIKPINEQVVDILNSDDKSLNKGEAIIGLVYDNSTLSSFKTLKLLPKSIIFDKNFNSKVGYEGINAQIDTKTGIVTVGTKWLEMFKEPSTRQQAIRKLIHEQLHYKLSKNRGYVRSAKAIYQEFKDNLDKGVENEWYKKWREANNISKEDADKHFRQYLFEGLNDDVAFEEFLVESLTSNELAQMLNSIDTNEVKGNKRKNLFQKILEFLSNVFGWNVRKGSLYEKELNTLRNLKDNVKQSKKNVEFAGNLFDNVEDNQQLNNTEQKPATTEQKEQKLEAKPEIKPEVKVDDNVNTPTTNKFGTNNSKRFRSKFRSEVTEINNNDSYNEEEESIINEAKQNGTFMKAPNGKQSNLNEKQWVQVRTKAFKDWFGDWERIAKINKAINANIESLKKELKVNDYLRRIKKFYDDVNSTYDDDYIKYIGRYFSSGYSLLQELIKDVDTTNITLQKANLLGEFRKNKAVYFYNNKIYFSSYGTQFDRFIDISHEIIHSITATKYDKDIKFKQEVDNLYNYIIKQSTNEDIKTYYGLSKPKELLAEIVNPYFQKYLLNIKSPNPNKKSILQDVIDLIKEVFNIKDNNRTVFEDIIDLIKDNAETFNIKDDVSKVVDENGEPLVVYSGKINPLIDNEFKINANAAYFTTDIEYANTYKRSSNKGIVYSCFLNIRYPLDYRLTNWHDSASKAYLVATGKEVNTENYELKNNIINELLKNDIIKKYDGVIGNDAKNYENERNGLKSISDGIEYVIFDGNQVKSANGNNGNYSNTDNNIYHSSITELKRTSNIPSFIDSLPTSIKPQVSQMIKSADLKISCK